MTLSPLTLQTANAIIAEVYSDLSNKGPVNSFIQPGVQTSDFELPEHFTMRAKEEKGIVYYNIFRVK